MGSRFTPGLAALAGASALLAMTSAHAGAGLLSSGDVSYSARFGYFTAEQRWDGDRRLQDSACRSEYGNSTHAVELGYSYYHTLYAQSGLARSSCGGSSETGLTDIRIGLRGRLNVYENDGSWELEATLPMVGSTTGERRLGCGALGLAANVHKRTELTPALDAEYGASAQWWESPLADQGRAYAGLRFEFIRRWSLSGGAQGVMPLDDGQGDPEGLLSDCGSEGRLVRGVVELKYRPIDPLNLGCGVTQAVWGEDAGRATGISCGFSYLWKD